MNLDELRPHFEDEATVLLRTDFSDDNAWELVLAAATAAADFGPPDVPDDDDDGDNTYSPHIVAIADRHFEGATGESLAVTGDPDEPLGYVLLADERSMREAGGNELTLVWVDLSVSADDADEFGDVLGREFRCVATQIANVEGNLSLGNCDFADFADEVEEDGVYRGTSGDD